MGRRKIQINHRQKLGPKLHRHKFAVIVRYAPYSCTIHGEGEWARQNVH